MYCEERNFAAMCCVTRSGKERERERKGEGRRRGDIMRKGKETGGGKQGTENEGK